MELSLEAYRLIINGITDRIDICALSRTSKGFQYAAERALYNTIYISNTSSALRLWESLSDQPRVSTLVEALTLSVPEDENGEVESLPTDYWNLLSRALARTTRLRHLNLHFNGIEDPPRAAILSHAAFRLRSFHCDFEWDHDLVKFLDAQVDLRDLYIADFKSLHTLDLSDTPGTSSTAIPPSDVPALPNLAILECTFTEAAVALVPGRPITHVKTCFSRTDMDEKRAEMSSLFSKIRLSSRNVHSIDIADSSYTESFSMEIISSVANMHPLAELRYIGTLVLPIDGQEVRVTLSYLFFCSNNQTALEAAAFL